MSIAPNRPTEAGASTASLAPVSGARSAWIAAMPAIFVLLWSTGFVGAKLGLPYAGPMTFLSLRFNGVAAVLCLVTLATGARWPQSWRAAGHIAVVGLLIQFVYLGGVFFGISRGVSAGVSALIVSLQPALTAFYLGLATKERLSPRQWLGIGLGLVGVALVVWHKVDLSAASAAGLIATVIALFGMTTGTLYQKRFCAGVDLLSSTTIQTAAAGLAVLACALLTEPMTIDWHVEFAIALAWLCLGLSVGATMLLLVLIRRGAAARTASLFYLVPPSTAVFAYLLFGETLWPTALVGMVVAAAGVALVNRG